ncbi:MAG TPA: N-acetylmuramoyl-L-alanine amidase [Vicinamibacterales bacterium]|nr:N-acetylmuramoyl-L-alanine amidase [Vicinamibacterales bacterium]
MFLPRSRLLIVAVLSASLAGLSPHPGLAGQAAGARPAPAFTVISPQARTPLPASQAGDQLMVALDDLAPLFGLTVREDGIGGGLTVTAANGKRVLLTPGQPLASADGRLVSLPAAPVRDGRRWLVPIEFLSRAIAPVAGTPIEVRRGSRLVLVGDVRVPRVEVRQQEAGGVIRLTLTVAPRAGHQVTHEGNRLLLRFDATALDPALPAVTPGPLLQGIRLGDTPATLAVDLGPRFGSYRASAATRDANSEVIVELVPSFTDQAIPVPPPSPPAAEPLVNLAPPRPSVRTVVIDAGHGGDEQGASGPSGALEKEVALAVARRLRAVLEGRLGLRVLMTRDADKAVSLDERAALANTNKADLFISLHANASLRPATRGAQVYFLSAGQGGEASRAALAGGALPTLGGGSRDVELILWDLAQVRHLDESAAFAAILEEELRGRIAVNERPVLQAPFRVLAAANMPAVVVETGYLTNTEDERLLKSAGHQDLIVQALLQSVIRFREVRERGVAAMPTGVSAPNPSRPPR